MWQSFFKFSIQDFPMNKPLSLEILHDTNHFITRFLVYLHTMQTFLFQDLKDASRLRDESKILTLGPYALCLSFILAKSN